MALSRPMPQFAHQHTVRLIVEEDMEIDALEIAKSLPEHAPNITGIVPQFRGKCFDITLDTAEAAIKLSTAGYDYGDARKPLRLLGAKSIHMSIFVSVEFPDDSLISLLEQYGELKFRKLRRLHFAEEGFTHIERGVRVAEFTRITHDIPKKMVLAGIEFGFKYSGQAATCYRCRSTEHVVKDCPKRRHPPPPHGLTTSTRRERTPRHRTRWKLSLPPRAPLLIFWPLHLTRRLPPRTMVHAGRMSIWRNSPENKRSLWRR